MEGLDVSKPTIPDVLHRFVEYLRKHPAWGSLHIVLDDGNVADQHVQYCIEYAEHAGDSDGAELGRVLLAMSKTQRGKIDRVAYRALTANSVLDRNP